MVKSPLARILLGLAALTLVAIAALALGSKQDIITSNDGRMAIALKAPSVITPTDFNSDAGLKTIAGNLSTYPFGTYFCCYGFTVAEGGTNFPFQTWVAIAFTPSADATVTKIKASVGAFGGISSGFELSINEDSSGVPGKALKKFHVATPPGYGQCCTLDTGNYKAGIPVTAGTQYWIVASTTSKDTKFLGGWAFNSTDMRSYLIAGWCQGSSTYCGSNSGKWIAGNSLRPGFAVLGN
jgi:hypothetical protein